MTEENRSNREKPRFNSTLPSPNPTRTGLGSNLGLGGDRPPTPPKTWHCIDAKPAELVQCQSGSTEADAQSS